MKADAPINPRDLAQQYFEEYNGIRRRVEKLFLCDLLVAWKACRASGALKPSITVPDKPFLSEAAE